MNFRQIRNILPMPCFRSAAVFLLLSAAALLMGALSSQLSSPSRPTPNPPADAAATKLLGEALARLGPDRVTWLETKVWQKGCLDRFTYEAEGHYLAGPNHRFRLELTTFHGRAAATSLLVSDGHTLWQGRRRGDGPWSDVSRVYVGQWGPTGAADSLSRLPDQVLASRLFDGIAPLLHALQSNLAWSRKETVRRSGEVYFKLTGAWSEEALRVLAPPDQPWPDGLPRRCRLYLDVQTLWPHRVEWWGPSSPRSPDALLLQIEFRDPVVNQPLSSERVAREFSVPHATGPALK
jgi:hypothetical protein